MTLDGEIVIDFTYAPMSPFFIILSTMNGTITGRFSKHTYIEGSSYDPKIVYNQDSVIVYKEELNPVPKDSRLFIIPVTICSVFIVIVGIVYVSFRNKRMREEQKLILASQSNKENYFVNPFSTKN
jgi:hypothetical protein